MPYVMCRRDWQGPFHRTINGVRTAFPPGEPIEVEGSNLKFIASDLGKALVPMDHDDKGVLRPVAKELIPGIVAGILEDAKLEAETAPAVAPQQPPAKELEQPPAKGRKSDKPSLPVDEM